MANLDISAPYPTYGMDSRHTFRSPYTLMDSAEDYQLLWRRYGYMSGVVPIDSSNIAYSVGPYYLYSYDKWGVETTLPNLGWMYSSSRCALTEGDLWLARHGGSLGGTFYPFRITTRNKSGITQWEHVFTTEFYMGTFEVRSDGTFVTCGSYNFPGEYNSWIIGLSSDGSTELFSTYTDDTGRLEHCVVDDDDYLYCSGTRRVGGTDNTTGVIRAYDEEGNFEWEYIIATGSFGTTTPTEPICVGEDGKICFGTPGNSLPFYALNPDGSLAWTKAIGPPSYALGVAVDGTIYAWAGTTLYALDPDDGATIWSATVAGVHRSIIDANGRILVGTATHPREAICFESDGTELWRFTFPAQGTTDTNYGYEVQPVIGTDHTLFWYTYGSLYNSAYGQLTSPNCLVVKRGETRHLINSAPISPGDKVKVLTIGKQKWILKSDPISPGDQVRRIKIGKKSVIYKNTPAWTPQYYT